MWLMGSSIIEKGARHVTILLTRFEGREKMEGVLVPRFEYSHTNRCIHIHIYIYAYICVCVSFYCSDKMWQLAKWFQTS